MEIYVQGEREGSVSTVVNQLWARLYIYIFYFPLHVDFPGLVIIGYLCVAAVLECPYSQVILEDLIIFLLSLQPCLIH
jgi:hypothetical protein